MESSSSGHHSPHRALPGSKHFPDSLLEQPQTSGHELHFHFYFALIPEGHIYNKSAIQQHDEGIIDFIWGFMVPISEIDREVVDGGCLIQC